MTYNLGIDEIEPNHWLAWVFDLIGCYSKGRTRQEAIDNSPKSIIEFINWAEGYEQLQDFETSNINVRIKEEFSRPKSEDDYWINAFFDDDRRLLSEEDIYQIKWLANCARRDLERIVQQLDSERLHRPITGEVQISIEGILMHIATAEWWYFDSFGMAFERADVPENSTTALRKVRSHTLLQLDRLADNNVIEERRGELWSARKICRRMLWHERAHTLQIEKYLGHG